MSGSKNSICQDCQKLFASKTIKIVGLFIRLKFKKFLKLKEDSIKCFRFAKDVKFREISISVTRRVTFQLRVASSPVS